MNKNIDTLFQDSYSLVIDLGIRVGTITSVKWNGRLKSCWGKCYRRWNGTEYKYWIELNPILNRDCVSWEAAMNTMIHEILHCDTDRFCHTGEWKRCAELVNREYAGLYHIERCTAAEEKGIAAEEIRKYRYSIYCVECGKEWKYGRITDTIKKIDTNKGCYRCPCGSYDLRVKRLF